MNAEIKLEHKHVWKGTYRGFCFEIKHWGEGLDYTPGGGGMWTFYVYLREDLVNDFESLWLPDLLSRFSPASPERVHHDYMIGKLCDIDLHGGITYYAKHGHTPGHRCVEVGCDYSHLWDHERGGGYDENHLKYDAARAIDSLFEKGIAKTIETKSP